MMLYDVGMSRIIELGIFLYASIGILSTDRRSLGFGVLASSDNNTIGSSSSYRDEMASA